MGAEIVGQVPDVGGGALGAARSREILRRREAIADQYRQAYGDGQGLGEEFEGWEEEGLGDDLEED